LGTDWGVTYLNESEFKSCYASLIQAILAESPDTRIILQSIFPVTEDCVNLDNAKIDTANGWVKDIAAENGCRYLDTQSVLKDGEGCLKKDYCSSADGIHLNKEAYEVGDLIHSAANIVEQAIRMEDPDSKKALRDAAKTLLQKAIDGLDESVGTAVADDEEDRDGQNIGAEGV
jgi:hypothetical protein